MVAISLQMRERSRPTHAQGLWATPPRHSSGHGEPGAGELGPLFPSPSAEAVFPPKPNPERNTDLSVSSAGRTQDIWLFKDMCISVAGGKKNQ